MKNEHCTSSVMNAINRAAHRQNPIDAGDQGGPQWADGASTAVFGHFLGDNRVSS